jgi:hypothetical protein
MTFKTLSSPAQIEAELTRIWETLEGANKMRASLFNLIFYVHNNHRAEYYRSIALKAIQKFPSRIIFIAVDQTPDADFLKSSVSVLPVGPAENDAACDFIQIDVAGLQQMRIPFVVLPHIVPDLPVYLVWAEDPAEDNPLAYPLEKLCTRLIFDSESTTNLPGFANAVLRHQAVTHADIADLNWARMESWRDLFSTCFYTDERLCLLKKTKTIKIQYNGRETPFFCHTKIQAIYFQAWLACQLEWKMDNLASNSDSLSFSYENGAVQISLVPTQNEKLAPGTIISVDLMTSEGHHFAFSRDPLFPPQINLILCTEDKCEIPAQFIFAKAESGQSLVKEIYHKRTSEHYLKVLHAVTKMDALTLC